VTVLVLVGVVLLGTARWRCPTGLAS